MGRKGKDILFPKWYDGNSLPSPEDLETSDDIESDSDDESVEVEAEWSDSSEEDDEEWNQDLSDGTI